MKKFGSIEIAFCVITLVIGTVGQTQICPKQCLCVNEETAHCTFDANTTSIPKILPTNLKVLTIVGGSIYDLKNDDLIQFQKLENLRLLKNNLKKIHEYTFVNLINLKSITIEKNQLDNIDTNAFGGLRTVKEITLNRNQIKNIKKFAFANSSMIKTIDLRYNPTELTIESNAFSNLHEVDTIHLPYNVTIIEANAFFNLSHVHFLDLNSLNVKNLDPKMFRGLGPVDAMVIRESRLGLIKSNTFSLTNGVKRLKIEKSDIKRIRKNSFADSKIAELEFFNNSIHRLERNSIFTNGNEIKFEQNKFDCRQCSNLWILKVKVDKLLTKNECFNDNFDSKKLLNEIDQNFIHKCGEMSTEDESDYDENLAHRLKVFNSLIFIISIICLNLY